LARQLLDATDPDAIIAVTGAADPDPAQIEAARETLLELATRPFDNPHLRRKLVEIQKRSEQTIDMVSKDRVKEAGFSAEATEQARVTVESFRRFIEDHRDEITALQLILNAPRRRSGTTTPPVSGGRRVAPTFEQIKELAERLSQPPHSWTTESLWRAYAQLEKDKVRGLSARRVLADVVSLVRHAVQLDDELVPYPERVLARYRDWLAAQEANGRAFTPEQRWWLDKIAGHVGVNVSITPDDFDYGEFFNKGGAFKARQVFGAQWPDVLDELNAALVG